MLISAYDCHDYDNVNHIYKNAQYMIMRLFLLITMLSIMITNQL